MIPRNTVCALTLAMLAGTASADVKAEFFISSTSTWVAAVPGTEVVYSSPSNDVLIKAAPSGATRLRVKSTTPTTESIGIVTVNDGTVGIVLISISGAIDEDDAIGNACLNWGGLAGTESDTMILQASISGDITGDVTADEIVRLDIGGDIDGDVVAATDDIGSIVVDGDILGDIESSSGKIGTVFADGDIGSTTNTVSIYAGADVSSQTGAARETISIIAADNIWADITASSTAAKEGRFRRILANENANLSGGITSTHIAGVLAGSIKAYEGAWQGASAIPCINAGAVSSEILFYDEPLTQISVDTLTGSIMIANSLDELATPGSSENIMIFIETTAGLEGQIVINQADNGGDWETVGKVGIGGTPGNSTITLSPSSSGANKAPYYEVLSSDIGGGAVGLAEFNFHAKESVPVADSGAMLDPVDYDSYEVTIEHYGRVYEGDTTDSIPAITIKYGTSISIWEDVTDDFDIAVSGTESTADRDIKITPANGFEWMNGFYTIVPNDLKCADVSGNPQPKYVFDSAFDPAAEFDDHYVFTISADTDCGAIGADVNGDGSLTPTDFTAWINAFNNNLPECDQNNDGSCTQADFTAWIDNYNKGCL